MNTYFIKMIIFWNPWKKWKSLSSGFFRKTNSFHIHFNLNFLKRNGFIFFENFKIWKLIYEIFERNKELKFSPILSTYSITLLMNRAQKEKFLFFCIRRNNKSTRSQNLRKKLYSTQYTNLRVKDKNRQASTLWHVRTFDKKYHKIIIVCGSHVMSTRAPSSPPRHLGTGIAEAVRQMYK